MGAVIIGVDPHKLSATIEVVDDRRAACSDRAGSRTDRAGYAAMRTLRQGVAATGSGRSRAPTVPGGRWRSGCWRPASGWSTCRPSWRPGCRLFDTGHNRKTDALDAHSIAIVAVRTEGLRVLKVDGELQALRMLVDRARR